MIRVLLDVDGVLADFPGAVVDWLNGIKLGCLYRIEDVKQHDIMENFGLQALQSRLDQWCTDTDMCRHLPVYEGAQVFVEELRSFAEVVAVTASYGQVRGWEHSRRAWLLEHFGIEKKDVVFCKRKELVAGNMLLDDKLRNIDAWRNAWGHHGQAVVFDRPWNQGLQFRVNSYGAALEAARHVAAMVSLLNEQKRPLNWSSS